MKNIKIISLLTFLCTFSLIQSSFEPYSTDKFIYTISKTEDAIEINNDQLFTNTTSRETITNNFFNTGIIRTRISTIIENNKFITTTETWTTKNPSYLTWTNAAIIYCIMYKIFNYPLSFTLDSLNREDLKNMTELEKTMYRAVKKASQGKSSRIEWFMPKCGTKQDMEDISNAIQRYTDKANIKVHGTLPPSNIFEDNFCIDMLNYDSDIEQTYIEISVQPRTISNKLGAWFYGKKK